MNPRQLEDVSFHQCRYLSSLQEGKVVREKIREKGERNMESLRCSFPSYAAVRRRNQSGARGEDGEAICGKTTMVRKRLQGIGVRNSSVSRMATKINM